MNSKERVHAALKHQSVDRIPIYMWFHPVTAQQLGKLLEIPPAFIPEAFGDDIRQRWVGNNYAMEGIVHEHDGESHTDFWGIKWIKSGPFNQIEFSPLQDSPKKEILEYTFPFEHIDDLLKNMESLIPYAKEYFIGCDISPCFLEMIFRLRGMENALLDVAVEPAVIWSLLQKSAEFALELARSAFERFSLDWLWMGDDVGGQHSMLVNPELWRQMIKPLFKPIVDSAKSKKLYVAYHSCGAIRPIIPDLIEIGIDVLNPIQCNCPGMDPAHLKKEFGKELSFMGGVDTQGLLPRGKPGDIQSYTERLIGDMTADGGGYILAASHTIPPETPFDNIFAMYKAAGVTREEIYDRASSIRLRINK